MKKIILLLILLSTNLIAHKMKYLEPIPKPQVFSILEGNFTLDKNTKLVFESFSDQENFFRDALNDELENFVEKKFKFERASSSKNNFIYFGNYKNSYYKDFEEDIKNYSLVEKQESYILSVTSERVVILSNNSRGSFYGLMSLLQIIKKEKGSDFVIRNCKIIDYPLIPMRGISDDIARGQVSTLDDFKKIIRFLARYKMNVYQPYFEDAIELKTYPDIGLGRGRVTQQEIKELVEYANKYFVEIIPIFQTLGHWENLLIQPKYYHLADFPGAASFDVTNEKTYEFIDNCVKELSKIFPSKYFHAGLDESWDVGLGNSKDLTDKIGIAQVHANHYKRVNEIIKKYGKKMLMYGDIIHNHPEIFEMLPKDIIVVDWRYGVQDFEPIVKKYKDYGIPFICSPSVTNYNRIFPHIENSIVNIRDFVKTSVEYGTIGFINSNWGDNGGENFREYNWFGYAFGAECSWNPTNVDVFNFKENFFKDFYGKNEAIFEAVYRLLSDLGVATTQYEFWRHPFLPNRENPLDRTMNLKLRAESMKSKSRAALKLLHDYSDKEIKNFYHLDFLKFAGVQGLWFGDKILNSMKIKSIIDKKNGYLTKSEREEISKLCDEMITKYERMKKEFRRLWLLTNKEDNLNLIENHKYDRQIAAWKEMKENLKQEIVSDDVKLKSPWIYHPEANPSMKDVTQVNESIFEKEIEITDKINSAKLQLIGDSFVELYINDKLAGDVRGRLTLSLSVESQRIKIFDIKEFLSIGKNKVKAVAKNFGRNASAGINVQIDIQTASSNLRSY
ncbi:MAG: beta-N-acetylhexosaminidase, partial [Ignavibacteria bacterium]|nr:beta-N-acetylhexosaminidase [Ignavibacteria bacterium]